MNVDLRVERGEERLGRSEARVRPAGTHILFV